MAGYDLGNLAIIWWVIWKCHLNCFVDSCQESDGFQSRKMKLARTFYVYVKNPVWRALLSGRFKMCAWFDIWPQILESIATYHFKSKTLPLGKGIKMLPFTWHGMKNYFFPLELLSNSAMINGLKIILQMMKQNLHLVLMTLSWQLYEIQVKS